MQKPSVPEEKKAQKADERAQYKTLRARFDLLARLKSSAKSYAAFVDVQSDDDGNIMNDAFIML